MRRLLFFLAVPFIAVLGACSGTADNDPDTSGTADVAPDRGQVATDAGIDTGADSTVDDLGESPDFDAAEDAADATPCSTGSRDGVCLHVDECDGARESVAGFCPGPTQTQCCVALDSAACNENPSWEEMPRPNEGLTEAAGAGGCPDGMVPVEAFCIDQYEAALIELLDDGSERHWSPYFNPGQRRVLAVSIAGAVPQGYISGAQAAAACAEAGKRLCDDDEWLRACQGPSGLTYPYGATRDPGACNDARDRHPVVDYFESTDNSIWSKLGNACINQQDDSVALCGAHPACVSQDGAFDMMGNLHEWTSTPSGTFRGGFYADTERNGPGCLYATTAHDTAHWDYSTGFRCCADR